MQTISEQTKILKAQNDKLIQEINNINNKHYAEKMAILLKCSKDISVIETLLNDAKSKLVLMLNNNNYINRHVPSNNVRAIFIENIDDIKKTIKHFMQFISVDTFSFEGSAKWKTTEKNKLIIDSCDSMNYDLKYDNNGIIVLTCNDKAVSEKLVQIDNKTFPELTKFKKLINTYQFLIPHHIYCAYITYKNLDVSMFDYVYEHYCTDKYMLSELLTSVLTIATNYESNDVYHIIRKNS